MKDKRPTRRFDAARRETAAVRPRQLLIVAYALAAALWGRRFWVNSAHHQAAARSGAGLQVTALADDGTTKTMNWWHPGMMALCQTFNVKEGDTAVLFGDETVTADTAAKWLNTINYEVTCLISPRVPRVYKG